MSVVKEAAQLRLWAEENGFFSQGRSLANVASDPLQAAQSFAIAAQSAFARKPITAIGYAHGAKAESKIFVYTRRKLTKVEIEGMEKSNPVSAKLEFRVALPFSVSSPSAVALFPLGLRGDRMTCGGSISIGNNREAGTLGALLRDQDGVLYGLSCNHVTGGCSNARVGMPIVAPGILDVGAGAPDLRLVGHHQRSLQFIAGDPSSISNYKNNFDAAVFRLSDPDRHSSHQGLSYPTPTAVVTPTEDLEVEKVGRSTGHTVGIIESCLSGSQRIDYKMTAYHSAEENSVYQGSVYYNPLYVIRGTDGDFSNEGDSGALVVTRRPTEAAVGLVIGGDPTNNLTYMLPLKPILDHLGFDLVSDKD